MKEDARRTEAEVERYFWRNYLAHSIEGGIYMAGLTFVAGPTVLPPLVKSLGGPAWLVSLMPVMMMVGFTVPQIFTAHLIERLSRYKPLLMVTGLLQRLPYLVAGLVLLFLARSHPRLTLAVCALTPLVSGLFGGTTSTAWTGLVARTIPERRLSSSWALRFVIMSALGIFAGFMVKKILHVYPGPPGYARLFLAAFAFLSLSYMIFALVKEVGETEIAEGAERTSFRRNVKDIPALLRGEALWNFIWMRVFDMGIFILVPFMAIYARKTTGLSEEFLGELVLAQTAGAIAGNVIGGMVGDRWGARILLYMNKVVFFLMCGLLLAWRTKAGFYTAFFLYGVGNFLNVIGVLTLSIQITRGKKRATSLALIAVFLVPAMIGATQLGAMLWGGGESLVPPAGCAAAATAAAWVFLKRIPAGAESRKETG